MTQPKVALIDRLYAIPFSIAAFFIVFVYSWHGGIGVSPDSIVYVSAARNLLEKGTLLGYDQFPVIDFPSFYPLFLAFIKIITHVDPVVAGPYVNGLMFAGVVYITGTVLNKFLTNSMLYKIIVLACIIIAPCLQEVYSMLWSETLFILLSLALMITLYGYFQNYSIGRLLLAGLVVAMLCVTRYAGIAFAGAGGALLLFDKQLPVRKKIIHIFIYSLVSISFLVINLLRNMHAGGFLTGNREKGITPLADNIAYFGSVVGNWLPFSHDNYTVSLIVGLIVLLVLTAVCIFHFIKNKKWFHTYENIVTVFAFMYGAFIILSSTISHYEKINDRLLSPMYIPLMLCFTCRIPEFIHRERPKALRYATAALAVIIAAGFFYRQHCNDLDFYEDVSTLGIPGFTDDSWVHSETVNFIQNNHSFFRTGCAIYSNAPESIYFNCGLIGDNLPNRMFPKDVETFYTEDHFYVVWFYNKDESPLALDEIMKHKNMQPMKTFKDGAIYFFEE